MPHIECKAVTAAVTADSAASAKGVLILDTTNFFAGAEAFLFDDDAGSEKKVLIMEIIDATHLGVLVIPAESGKDAQGNFGTGFRGYGRSDVSAYTLAKHAKLAMPSQVVRVEYSYVKSPT